MSLVRNILNGFIKVFGDIKVFRWPLFIIYDPGSYLVKGYDMRQVIKIARPGDILLRGYNNYLDGYFIPGYFSHTGLYVGNINPAPCTPQPAPCNSQSDFRPHRSLIHRSLIH